MIKYFIIKVTKRLHRILLFTVQSNWIFQSIQFIGIFTFGIGFSAVVGLRKWHEKDIGMALNTAIGFIMIGIAFLLIMVAINKMKGSIDELEKSFK